MEVEQAAITPLDTARDKAGLGPFLDNVIPRLWQWHAQDQRCALLTLVNIEGASPRPLGSQLAVSETGATAGLISGGCVEPALVLEAQSCIATGEPRLLRLGKDSDYFDLQLPCGSGIDVLIQPLAETSWLAQLQARLGARQATVWQYRWPGSVGLSPVGEATVSPTTCRSNLHHRPTESGIPRARFHSEFQTFERLFEPRSRLVVVGQGAIYEYFLHLLQAFDVDLVAYSRDPQSARSCARYHCLQLTSPDDFDATWLDAHSALVILSHDHAWEVPILERALAKPAHYVAALGSRTTHRQRLQALRALGVEDSALARIKGPAGLDIGANSPPEIALAILAEWLTSRRSAAK